jgi:hypothetical protein
VRELADMILAAQGRNGDDRLARPPAALARKAR